MRPKTLVYLSQTGYFVRGHFLSAEYCL